MMKTLHLVAAVCGLLLASTAAAYFYLDYQRYQSMHIMPEGLHSFRLTDPLLECGYWKAHMPSVRDAQVYRLYIDARKLWRSKLEWELSREEAMRILVDVKTASDKGDWGAYALMSYFYREGLGTLRTNRVLKPDLIKSVEMARMAAKAGQPWGYYDLGVAHEHGYGGAAFDREIAWAYYRKAAQLGSPDAQLAIADAYSDANRFGDEEVMLRCAYIQGHGAAAYRLGMLARTHGRHKEAIDLFQDGVKFGSNDCAATLQLLFGRGHWRGSEDELSILANLGIKQDTERAERYGMLSDALEVNPDLKLTGLDAVLPLPPAQLPKWNGVEDAMAPESAGPPSY